MPSAVPSHTAVAQKESDRAKRLNMVCLAKHSPQKSSYKQLDKTLWITQYYRALVGNDKIMGRLCQGELGARQLHTCMCTHTHARSLLLASKGSPDSCLSVSSPPSIAARKEGTGAAGGHTGLLGRALPAKASTPQVHAPR